MSETYRARFSVGQLIHHKLFDYRGVIIDVDATFQGTDEWYETMALNRPPKNEPWYHVLVHDAVYRTYVAERNLEIDTSGDQVNHPELNYFFDDFQKGAYITHRSTN